MLLLTLQYEQNGVGDRAIISKPGARVQNGRNKAFLKSTKIQRVGNLSKRADYTAGNEIFRMDDTVHGESLQVVLMK